MFIPEVIWREVGDELVPLRRTADPEGWLRPVYGPGYVVTQVDDGAPAGSRVSISRRLVNNALRLIRPRRAESVPVSVSASWAKLFKSSMAWR